MKLTAFCLALSLGLADHALADLTLVQKVDGLGGMGGEMTVWIKGDKARIDATPQITTIVDGKTGEIVTLMKDQKRVVRISADKMKAATEMIKKFSDKKAPAIPAKPLPTGRKDVVNGYDVEEYTVDTPMFKAAYWVAPKFPDGAAILKELQSVKSEIWSSASSNGPDYAVFPFLPIKTVLEMGTKKITTTLISANQDPLSDADFAIPKDFQELNVPDIGRMLSPGRAHKDSPHP